MAIIYEKRDISFEAFFVPMDFYPHIHETLEIIYLCEGEVTITIGSSSKTLHAGELSIVFPNIVHSYHSTQPNYVLTVIFSPELVENYHQLLFSRQPKCPFLSAGQIHPDIINAFNTIAVERYWTLDQRLLQGYLSVILGQILNHTELVEREKTVSFLPELLTYLSKHFMEPLTLDNLAHHLGVSKYQISRFFSQKIGCNFSTYLNALRVQHAEKLLTATDFPVTEICYLAVFESLSTFYRVFSQINGISPTAYKKKY